MKKKSSALTIVFSLTLSFFFSDPVHALRVVEKQVVFDELDDYILCQKKDYSGDFCQDALRRWVKNHPADVWKAAKMTRKTMNSWVAIPLFEQAFASKQGECKDEDVHLAVVAGLNLPPDRTEILGPAKKIGLELCFNEMKDKLVESADSDSFLFKNICKDLSSKGLITGLKAKKCK